MAKIVISYRHKDAPGMTRAIYQHLCHEYPNDSVFMDVRIPLGADFPKHLNEVLNECDVLISVVGPRWLGQRKGRPFRIHDEKDWIRLEIETALQRGIVILPVLVEHAHMPTESQLPASLQAFCFRIAAPVDSGRDFDGHMLGVVERINQILAAGRKPGPWGAAVRSRGGGSVPVVRARPVPVDDELRQDGRPIGPETAASPGRFVPAAAKGRIEPVDDAASVFRDCDGGPEMVRIPCGRFIMGAAPDEEGSTNDERPQHEVTFAGKFALACFPVTFAQWAVAQADNGIDRAPSDHGWGAADRPVIDVSWEDAQKYVQWLSRKSGKRYRLPTEAEWEYAARAGGRMAFCWGPSISSKDANFDARYAYGRAKPGEYRKRTVAVDAFGPNTFGLYQMHGNVWEWCEDHWAGDHVGAPCDGTARVEPERAGGMLGLLRAGVNLRVVRGGSWKALPKDLRSARRSSFPQDYRANVIGFRVARSL
jgi:formylglycine-generating enzyme required for sulfatase activity